MMTIELYGRMHYTDYLYKPDMLRKGIISTPGHDWGGGQHSDLEIIWKSEDYGVIIAKMQGHTAWSGIGETTYYPTYYKLLERHRLYKNDRMNEGLRYVLLGEFEFGRYWQKGLVALVRLALKLADGEVTDIQAEVKAVKDEVGA